ncbi:MAG: hypothetical protein ABSH06_02850, partial [Thermodesulfobacteriota bacterium]
SGTMMRYIQKAICGAKTFSDTPIYSQLQNIIFATVEDQLKGNDFFTRWSKFFENRYLEIHDVFFNCLYFL